MKTSDIRVGDRLILKPARRVAYDWPARSIVVARLTYRDGYTTPHVWTEEGAAFKPSDFARHA
jgi:hypothetical protein